MGETISLNSQVLTYKRRGLHRTCTPEDWNLEVHLRILPTIKIIEAVRYVFLQFLFSIFICVCILFFLQFQKRKTFYLKFKFFLPGLSHPSLNLLYQTCMCSHPHTQLYSCIFISPYLLLPFNLYVAWSSVLFTQVNLTALFCGSGISPLSFLKELVQAADFSVSGPPYSHLLPEGHSKMQI